MQKFKGVTGDCCKDKTNVKEAYGVYKVNTNSSQANVVMEKIKSALVTTQSKAVNKNNNIKSAPIGYPNLQESVIVEENRTGENMIITPIDNGVSTVKKVSYTKYNQTTNEIGDIVVYTAKTNFTKYELDANPELYQDSFIILEVKSQTGQILYNRTVKYSDKNLYNKIKSGSLNKNGKVMGPLGCFTSCVEDQFDAVDSWYEQLFCSVFGSACAAGIALGCWSGCGWAWTFGLL